MSIVYIDFKFCKTEFNKLHANLCALRSCHDLVVMEDILKRL